MTKREFPEVIPECQICKGTGWIWSSKVPGLRNLCVNCNGFGGVSDA